MHCARAVAPQMISRGSGRIISLSSLMGGWWGWSEHVHYNASKSGIEGLTRGLAMELGPHGVTVNAVAPGFIWTAQSMSVEHSVGPEGLALAVPFMPLRRIGDPEDIADVVLFLASDASRYMTGQTLLVDGGITLGDLSSVLHNPARPVPTFTPGRLSSWTSLTILHEWPLDPTLVERRPKQRDQVQIGGTSTSRRRARYCSS